MDPKNKNKKTFIPPLSRIPFGLAAGMKGAFKSFPRSQIPRGKVGGFVKKYFLFLVIFPFFAAWIFLFSENSYAIRDVGIAVPQVAPNLQGVDVNTGQQTKIELWKIIEAKKEKTYGEIAALAWRRGLNFFLQTLAIDTATYIASGGEGQQPLFYTEGWGTYLTRVGDNAAGHFINDFARGLGFQNICTPKFNLKLGISLGLKQTVHPSLPACTFSQMVKNWESASQDPLKFLNGIDAYFNPDENDLAVGLSVYTNFYQRQVDETTWRASERKEADGIKPVYDKISGAILTPGTFVRNAWEESYGSSPDLFVNFTGHAAADAVDTFSSTLASKFLKRMFEKGLALKSNLAKEKRFDWKSLESVLSPDASPGSFSTEDARREFSLTFATALSLGDPRANKIEVTSDLLRNNLINFRLKTAIDRTLTISQALKDGLLNIDGPGSTFGFTSANNQPDANEGYSYNSMVILRKYRIFPVGWELAAQYIKNNFQNKVFSLGDIIREYDNPSSPFYHLIDVNWVLKAHETYCRFTGPGDELAQDDWRTEKLFDDSQEPPREYNFNSHNVTRQDYCADSKSCIYEDGNGNCIYYGYCTEEKPTWKFNGEKCQGEFNTCQTFTNTENEAFQYIASTLNSQDCTADTSGCQWLCADFNPSSRQWTCLAQGERTYRACENPLGCGVVDPQTGATCVIPKGAINCAVSSCGASGGLLVNGGFENQGAFSHIPANWKRVIGGIQDITRVTGLGQKVFSGSYSLRLSYFGGPESAIRAVSNPLKIEKDSDYTLTGKIFSSLTYGRAYLAIVDDQGNFVSEPEGCKTVEEIPKGEWKTVRCDFSHIQDDPVYIGAIIEKFDTTNFPSGEAWFDEIALEETCPSNDVTIYMNSQAEERESKKFFTKNVVECDEKDVGCSQLIRTKAGLGTNLIVNGSFEDWNDALPRGWDIGSATTEKITEGAMTGTSYLRLKKGEIATPLNVGVEGGRAYIVSLYARSLQNSLLEIKALSKDDKETPISFQGGVRGGQQWKRFVSQPIIFPQGSEFRLSIIEGEVSTDIDGVMIEEVERGAALASTYGDYGAKNVIYEKKAPLYLQCTGNPETDHTSCSNYAPLCRQDEVGCELYRPQNGEPAIPGVVSEFDRCPRECVGYDAFKKTATNFEQAEPAEYFIPSTAKQCSAQSAGCDEFTNLDEAARGGEGKEYFKYLRQCQKPDNNCGTFYTWVGSDTEGFQLKVYSLRDSEGAGPNGIPDQVPNPRTDLGLCRSLHPEDAVNNPNCREFYSSSQGAGKAQYIILQNTISCTDQCFAYRRSGGEKDDCEFSGGAWGVCKSGGKNLSQGECNSVGGFILTGSSECWTREKETDGAYGKISGCTDKGLTFESRDQCIYQAVPKEGEKCSQTSAGCREYRGGASGNIRTVFHDNFETATAEPWIYGRISSDAVAVGGHSLASVSETGTGNNHYIETFAAYGDLEAGKITTCGKNSYPECAPDKLQENCFDSAKNACVFYNGSRSCIANIGQAGCGVLNGRMAGNADYIVSFWAKTPGSQAGDVTIQLRVPDDKNDSEFVDMGKFRVTQEWQQYSLGPVYLKLDTIKPHVSLVFNSLAIPVNYDFVSLKLVQEYMYRIKNSWNTPLSCDSNPYIDAKEFPPPNAPQFMLGCKNFKNTSGATLYLKSFNKLCREQAVGCEQMIDTHNTNSPFPQIFNEQYTAGKIEIPDDSMLSIVNNPKYACQSQAKGCAAFGEPKISSDSLSILGYDTKHFVNNPDEYAKFLCHENAVGCAEFVSDEEGLVYFKDPKTRTCEYRSVSGTSFYGWFQNGSTASFPDCPTKGNVLGVVAPTKSCVGGQRPGAACEGDNECAPQGRCVPWTGICPEEANGCRAYVDPQGVVNSNILVNGNFEGYFKICSQRKNPCLSEQECSEGETCGPDTAVNEWIFSSKTDIDHVLKQGFAGSSGIVIQTTGSSATVSQGRALESATLYTISGRSKKTSNNALLIVETNFKGALSSFDNSLSLSDEKDSASLKIVNAGEDYKIFSGRFFVHQSVDASITISSIQGFFDDIELKPTGVYYNLSKDVDRRSCSGVVNPENGCVLFNEVDRGPLIFSALNSKSGAQPTLCSQEGTCDSNMIAKVIPDRVCGSWLECVSGREQVNYKTGKKEVFCQQIAECAALNPINGQCNNFPRRPQEARQYDPGSVDLLKNITGYAKVGFTWSKNSSIEGYYPYSAMQQRRICVEPQANYGEECLEDEDCQTSPLEHDGICQPVLQVRDDRFIYQSCRVYPESSSPRWGEKGPNDTGDTISASVIVDVNNPLGQKNWKGVEQINQKILSKAAECTYKKDEILFEGIYGFCVEKDPQSPYLCLNWLPVDEITGGFIGVSGWNDNLRDSLFYCTEGAVLETRKGNKETKCYQKGFWKAAVLTGVTLGVGPGVDFLTAGSKECGSVHCPKGYLSSVTSSRCGGVIDSGTECAWKCVPDPSDYKFTDDKGVLWYDYKDKKDKDGNFVKKHLMYCPDCKAKGEVLYDPEKPDKDEPAGWLRVCSAVTKVTDDDGANRSWKRRLEASREFEGSGYQVPDYGYTIANVTDPFGSIGKRWKGNPSRWPYLTDIVDATKFEKPLSPSFTEGENIGEIYHDVFSQTDPVPFETNAKGGRERIKRLFAQNFGTWKWNGTSYQMIPDKESRCVGGSLDDKSCTNQNQCVDTFSTCDALPGFCGYFENGKPQVLDDSISCGSDPTTCASAVFCATGICAGDDFNTSSKKPCIRGGANNQCPVGEKCKDAKYGRCTGDTAIACTDSEDCGARNVGACDKKGDIGICSTGLEKDKACVQNSDCDTSGAQCVGKCSVNSAIAGSICYAKPGSTADEFCQKSGECVDFSYWIPPRTICKGNTRSNYFTETPQNPNNPANVNPNDPLAPGDWCGISPQLFNMSVQNSILPVFEVHGGAGEITLNFNVKVDDNQLPLKRVEVDWGDSTPRTISASRFGIKDKPDVNDPFSFPHVYVYNKAEDKGCASKTCDGYNEYQMHILVKDNWGWCTCRNLGQGTCNPASSLEANCPAQENVQTSNSWLPVSTKVQVYEK